MIKAFQLPGNFTGSNTKPLDFQEFKSFCYSLQGLGLINVQSIRGYEYPKNYYVASVNDQDGTFHIYLNCYCGFLALGEITDETQVYLSKPSLEAAAATLPFPYQWVSPEILQSQSGDIHFKNLGKDVLNEVKPWLPSSIGELLFSWYFD